VSIDEERLFVDRWVYRDAIIRRGVLLKGVDPWWYDGAPLSDAEKNVLRILRRNIEPVRVIERAGVNTDHPAETLEAQVELGPAISWQWT
jgi:hypothetical protein